MRTESDDSKDEFGEVVCFLRDGCVQDDELTLDSRVVKRELEEHDSRADVVTRHGLERRGRERERDQQRDASQPRLVQNSLCEQIPW